MSALLLASLACRSGEEGSSSDSSQIDSIRAQSDSVALEMARAIASTSISSGAWSADGDSSTWTARMLGEHVSIIEEQVRFADGGTAVRGYFFAQTGELEQISEARRPGQGSSSRASETRIDFTDSLPRAERQVEGATASVTAEEIRSLQAHAAELVNAARAAAPTPSVR